MIVPTPAYMPFLSVPKLYDVDVIEIEMLQSGDAETGEAQWVFDFDAIERAFAAGCHAFVLCNPHNPIGKVLTLEEELRLSDLAAQYDVRIFNDEIHAPFVFEGKHIPFPTISEQAALQSMTATSASKSFNIPGTKCAQVLLTNPADRDMWAVKAEWSEHQTATIGAIATTTAYNEGDLCSRMRLPMCTGIWRCSTSRCVKGSPASAISNRRAHISHGLISRRLASTIRPHTSLRRRKWR